MNPTTSIHAASSSSVVTASVLIPTYRRTSELRRCLNALLVQTRSPDELIITLRIDDDPTRQLIDEYRNRFTIRVVLMHEPGLLAARNAGLASCSTDILCTIDDDTEPHRHWLEQVVNDFTDDPSLGGLGGRDFCFDGVVFDIGKAETVGKLQWFGRTIGNHHLGYGTIREVDLLKGANMSFRREAITTARCDVRLRGKGAQPSEDISLCVEVRRQGWKIAYDPQASVNHYPGRRDEARHYGGVAPVTDINGFRDFAYNEVIGLWGAFTPARKAAFMIWSLLIGTGVCPGLLQAVRFTPRLGLNSWKRFGVAQQGKWAAFFDLVFA